MSKIVVNYDPQQFSFEEVSRHLHAAMTLRPVLVEDKTVIVECRASQPKVEAMIQKKRTQLLVELRRVKP